MTMPEMLIYGKRPGGYPDQAFPVEHRPAPPGRSSMTHPVHATGPYKRACTAPTKFSVQCALQFSSNSWSPGTRQRSKTITNISVRFRTHSNGEAECIGSSAEPPYLRPDQNHWRTLVTQHRLGAS